MIQKARFSKNFSYREMIYTDWGDRHNVDNTPPDLQTMFNLSRMVNIASQPLREEVGLIITNSGYRCPTVNVGVGGAADSYHMKGLAHDIVSPEYTPMQLAEAVKDLKLPVDKVLVEFPHSASGGWLHLQVAQADKDPRNLYMVFEGNKDDPTITLFS